MKTPEAAPQIAEASPDWLDEGGRAVWAAYMPKLRAMGYVKDTDRLAFARLCDHTARWLRLRLKVGEKGESYTTESRHGTMERMNPDFMAMLRVEDKIFALEDRFGLSPSSRQSIIARMGDPLASELPLASPQASKSPPIEGAIGLFAPRPQAGGRPN